MIKYPRINKFLAVDPKDLKNKLIEEFVEVKICMLSYFEINKDDVFFIIILYKLLEELEDLAQIVKTFSYYNTIHIKEKEEYSNLRISDLFVVLEYNVKKIKNNSLDLTQLETSFNTIFNIVQKTIGIICSDNDIRRKDVNLKHLDKLSGRGYTWSEQE